MEKSNPDFPTLLGNPEPPGIPTFRTASAAAVCMTNTYRTKGDISIVLKQGTFLMHYDTKVETVVDSEGEREHNPPAYRFVQQLSRMRTEAPLFQNAAASGGIP